MGRIGTRVAIGAGVVAAIAAVLGVAGFSSLAQPDGFWVRVLGTRMQAETNLFEPPRLTLKRVRDGYRPLMTLVDGVS